MLFFFCIKMIKVIYAIFAIAIKDPEVHLGDSNLILRKSVIQFELLALKRKTDNYLTDVLYYQY